MAKILKKTNHLGEEVVKLQKEILSLVIKVFIFLLSSLMINIIVKNVLPSVIFGICVLPIIAKIIGIYNVYIIKKTGYAGEVKMLKIFECLPDTYSIIPDLEIEVEGKHSQIDTVIIGSNGVFAIETKNMSGKIYGKSTDKQVSQKKTSRKGNIYNNTFYNPVKQVGTHVYRLAQALKEENVNIWVQGIVYFSNPNSNVCIESNNIPVFSCNENGPRQISEYIMKYNDSRSSLSAFNQFKIENLLMQYTLSKKLCI